MKIQVLTALEWGRFSQIAHSAAFGKDLAQDAEQLISYALLLLEGENPIGYVTAQLREPKRVYWKFGGALPLGKGRYITFRGFQKLLDFEKSQGRNEITAYIENTNSAMLRMAASVGFLIVGLKYHLGHILLEHCLLFEAPHAV